MSYQKIQHSEYLENYQKRGGKKLDRLQQLLHLKGTQKKLTSENNVYISHVEYNSLRFKSKPKNKLHAFFYFVAVMSVFYSLFATGSFYQLFFIESSTHFIMLSPILLLLFDREAFKSNTPVAIFLTIFLGGSFEDPSGSLFLFAFYFGIISIFDYNAKTIACLCWYFSKKRNDYNISIKLKEKLKNDGVQLDSEIKNIEDLICENYEEAKIAFDYEEYENFRVWLIRERTKRNLPPIKNDNGEEYGIYETKEEFFYFEEALTKSEYLNKI